MLVYSCQGQKSKVVLIGLKSRCGQSCAPFRGSRGEQILCIASLWCLLHVACSCITPASTLIVLSALTLTLPILLPIMRTPVIKPIWIV